MAKTDLEAVMEDAFPPGTPERARIDEAGEKIAVGLVVAGVVATREKYLGEMEEMLAAPPGKFLVRVAEMVGQRDLHQLEPEECGKILLEAAEFFRLWGALERTKAQLAEALAVATDRLGKSFEFAVDEKPGEDVHLYQNGPRRMVRLGPLN